MRRTYGSKKASVGGIDHREMISMIDEKSSVFDAFYIQNIKQTKRELSCMGSSNRQGVSSSKVRKRKYVKRIVKEVQSPVRESLSESVFLTPDRSIRVNKAPDLFDQLLNSSPACADAKQFKKVDLFDKLRHEGPTKTYNRKKPPPIKKFNYSSSDDTTSDKENSVETDTNETQNVTDIQAYELLIEKEHHPSPNIDESIHKIIQNISLLNNLNSQKNITESVKKNFRCNKNRLTKNMNTPRLQSSPLSSTPFTEKFRSKSIYQFSPIPMGNMDESSNHLTNVENINESVVFVSRNSFSKLKKSQSENRISPVTHLESKYEINKTNVNKLVFNEGEITPECSSFMKVEQQAGSVINSLQISNAEPFLGFTNDTNGSKETISFCNDKKNKHNKTDVSNETKVTEKIKSKDVFDDSSIELTEPSKPFYGFSNVVTNNEEDKESSFVFSITKKSNSSNNKKTCAHPKDDCKKDISQNDYVMNCSYENVAPPKPLLGLTNINTQNETNSDSDDKYDLTSEISLTHNISQDSQGRESLYDTCNSDQSYLNEDDIITTEPIVTIEKMDLSLFQKYYEKMPNFESTSEEISESHSEEICENHSEEISESHSEDISESQNSSNDYAGMKTRNSQDITGSSTDSYKADNSITCNVETGSNFGESENDESIAQDNISHEEECISFVTRRKRPEITNISAIFVLDDSYTSSNSGCDKTVLSNHKMDKEDKYVNLADLELENENESDLQSKDNNISEDSLHNEPRIFVTTRKSTKLFREANVSKTQETVDVDKPVIVLQPGKKWERSLSIYRRATTMTDHFDHSLLEDEDLNSKGRKYRQSVINTLELQETIGSVSNESFKSRRSTFISKPSRSTIRIVKEPNARLTLSNTTVLDDLKAKVSEAKCMHLYPQYPGFLEDCDDTVIELSKLSIAESDRDITVLEKIHDSRVTTARDYVLRRCNQTDTLLFDECYPDTLLKNCQKIGEGVYGEVYLYRGIDGRPRVMKIVPIAGSIKVNGEQQKDFDEVISEIVIAMELSALRAPIAEINRHFDEGKDVDSLNLQAVENATDVFNEVLAVKCVYGNYPSLLLDRWDLYDEIKGSENDNPAILPPDQQYIVLELANAGQDLESFQFNNAEQAYALFYQVAYGLAVAEEAFQFEHRDLHWGNVLIAPTDQKYATFVLRGRAHRVARCGVAASVIDYSLSRISLPLAGAGGDSAALYNDLAADDGLFGAVGDYQFSVYRLMREKLGNDWKNYEPYTNILWLHYVVDKMITALRYKRTTTKTHKQYINKLKEIKERLLNYGSATLFVLT